VIQRPAGPLATELFRSTADDAKDSRLDGDATMATLHAPTTTLTFPSGAFRQMGWAFLFLGISVGPSFRLGQENFLIDVLPDFVGYLMIATAANRLVPFHRRARAVRNLALLLTYLTIPTIVQYSVVTSQSGNVTTSKAPHLPLAIVLGLFELVLVWMLCGLVAGLARRAGDDTTEHRARGRRVIYIFFKILLTGGLALVLLSPNRELIIGGAIAAVAIGLVLIVLMMGLMWRAERMCEERPEVALASAEAGAMARSGGWTFHLLAIGGVILPIVLAVGAFYYYQEWQRARDEEERKASNSNYFSPARDEFYGHLRAGLIDEAYVSTTTDFKTRISRERFGELARRYADYLKLCEKRRGLSGAGSTLGHNFLSEREYAEADKGKIVQVTLTIRRERDSILQRTPPPVKVDDFGVEEKAQPDWMWPPFGQPQGPGR
jgi:hypothetical protein